MNIDIIIPLVYGSFWMLWIAFWFLYGQKGYGFSYKINNIFDMYFKVLGSLITGIGLVGRAKKAWPMIVLGLFMLLLPALICGILGHYNINLGIGLGC